MTFVAQVEPRPIIPSGDARLTLLRPSFRYINLKRGRSCEKFMARRMHQMARVQSCVSWQSLLLGETRCFMFSPADGIGADNIGEQHASSKPAHLFNSSVCTVGESLRYLSHHTNLRSPQIWVAIRSTIPPRISSRPLSVCQTLSAFLNMVATSGHS